MNEITRIHLAKVPYSIELDAKKQLQKYLEAITAYAGSELAADVEARMVEILAERKITADSVIALADVKALKDQLGAPEEFSDDSDGVVADKTMHRLYRDTTRSWLGGVAAGIARYFGINPLWIRLIFIVLAFVSFGTLALIYLILWVIIPPVKTVADLLQLEGKPATVAAIHALNERGEEIPVGRDRRIARIASIIVGVGVSLAGLGLLAATIIGSIIAVVHHNVSSLLPDNPTLGIFVGIALVAGILLFILLHALVAYFLFTWRWTKRLWIGGIVVIVLGLAAVTVVLTTTASDRVAFQQRLDALTRTATTSLPADFRNVTSLSITSEGVDQVTYIVSNQSRIEVSALPGGQAPKVSVDGSSATITLNETSAAYRIGRNSAVGHETTVTIYGPALQTMTVEGSPVSYEMNGGTATTFTAHVHPGAQLALEDGTIEALNAILGSTAEFDATNATVHAATVTLDTDSNATLGNISSLGVTAPDACPTNGSLASIEVGGVNDSHVTYNGKQMAKQSMSNACAELTIDN